MVPDFPINNAASAVSSHGDEAVSHPEMPNHRSAILPV
jgi:hypothetical protein